MLITIPDLMSAEDLTAIRADLETAAWRDGQTTAGPQAAEVKFNRQLALDDPVTQRWAVRVGQALGRSQRFMQAAIPRHTLPPLFSRYEGGNHYGVHVDTALRLAGKLQVRTDLAATLFLSDPDSYTGGALSIETHFGPQKVRLPAGSMVLYPASSRHQVEPVTRGSRLAGVFWVQSMIRDDAARELLFDLQQAMHSLGSELGPNDPRVVVLSATCQNLLRRWAET